MNTQEHIQVNEEMNKAQIKMEKLNEIIEKIKSGEKKQMIGDALRLNKSLDELIENYR